jgi:uroporphyrinogen-III synthase
MNRLDGLTVLVTRSDEAGAMLCQKIEAEGGGALHYPTLAFAPPPSMAAYQAAMAQLHQQAWLIFISPQAVTATLPELLERWPHLASRVKVACVGGATARALQAVGIEQVLCPDREWSSEGLLNMEVFQWVQGVNIAIIRGEGGREKIDRILNDRGANVLPVIAYQRVIPNLPPEKQAQVMASMAEKNIDIVIATSFSSVENLKKMVDQAVWPILQATPICVMSERVQSLAQEAGFQNVWVNPTVSDEAIISLLVRERNRLCQMKQQR